MRRFPNHAITKALVALISDNSDISITDHVDEDVALPYVVVGDINTNETDTKDETVSTSIVQIDIYSEYMGEANWIRLRNLSQIFLMMMILS